MPRGVTRRSFLTHATFAAGAATLGGAGPAYRAGWTL